ncbi:hypothetical protein HYU22_04930 [Candidatus Woesearchaeota archaeon]|nr:hypothetical protein [Candidatus Woesearchaeota archaeon]
MTLQLSGQSERLPEPHREFYGETRLQMPLLVSGKDEHGKVVDVPRIPASFAYVLERRLEAPKDVREAWQDNYFFTGDGSAAGTEGDHLIVLDAQPLRELTAESELYQSALVLPAGAWQELKSQQEKVFHLTADEVQEARGQGYVKKDGIWTPANKAVAKVWDTLSRGRDLTSYVQLVSESSPRSDSLLNVYFNSTTKDGMPTMRPWVADRIYSNSNASGYDYLNGNDGRLVGVAPEAHVAREKALEARVQLALEAGNPFEFNGRVYAPVSGVSLK